MKKILKVILMVVPTLLSAEKLDIQKCYDQFPPYVLAPGNLIELKHDIVVDKMNYIHQVNPKIELTEVGRSVEGRSINMFSFGKGETKILLWSQMHGDEPTATAGLLALFNFLAANFDQPFVQNLYKNLSIHAIVMLNPDGAERFQRRNALGIDINRDAQRLATPEAQALKNTNDRIQPDIGFNLHDMRGRETVGESGKLLTKALMAPPFNKANEDSPSRLRAKKLTLIIKNTLDHFIEGHIARYKADYMPRAFGDAFQNWGVSTVLIESGLTNNPEPHFLSRLVFVSLLGAFDAVSGGYVEELNPAHYDLIPLEGIEMFDLMIKNALIFNGTNNPSFTGDIGINIDEKWENKSIVTGQIEDIGDLSVTSGRKIIEGKNLIITPGFVLPSDKTENNLLKQGITTVVDPNNPVLKNLSSFPDGNTFNSDNIHLYTSEPAKYLDLVKKGRISINMIADLLIFQSDDKKNISMDKLKYVIQNGQIVFERE